MKFFRAHCSYLFYLRNLEWLGDYRNSFKCSFVRSWSSVSAFTTIKCIHEMKPINKYFRVQGWIKAIRKHKGVTFFDLYDGTCSQVLQITVDPRLLTDRQSFSDAIIASGSSVDIEGEIIPSPHPKQILEMKAKNITVVGSCDPEIFPIPVKQQHSLDYLRQFLHLRPRTRVFSSLLKIRNTTTMALHKYFQNNGYSLIHTPILTNNNAEGGGDIFKIVPLKNKDAPQADIIVDETSDDDEEFPKEEETLRPHSVEKESKLFEHDVFLTVSGQLHLEAIACGGLPKVYTLGPVFRAENTRTRRHLNEFYMLEAEIAFIQSLEDILQVMEDMTKKTAEEIYRNAAEEFFIINKYLEKDHSEPIKNLLKEKFIRISYTEAIDLLNRRQNPALEKLNWGMNLLRKHEEELVKLCGNIPVFLTDFPADIKAFYMKANKDSKTVAAVDLLVPEVGELCGGSLREDQYDKLKSKSETDCLNWYLELRQFGTVPHGGFGLGLERFLRFLTGIRNVKDTIPFPRWPHHCSM